MGASLIPSQYCITGYGLRPKKILLTPAWDARIFLLIRISLLRKNIPKHVLKGLSLLTNKYETHAIIHPKLIYITV